MQLSIRSIAAASVLGLLAASAQANLTLPLNFTQSNSVQQFPTDVLQLIELVYVKVEGKGTTTAVGASVPDSSNPSAFSFPVTKIVIGAKLNIASGTASGSALVFSRADDDGLIIGFTLANFTIDYVRKQVLADTTAFGGVTQKQMAVYNFHVATPLALKYKFPLSVTGHEVLDKLFLTPEAKVVFTTSLVLPDYATSTLDLDYARSDGLAAAIWPCARYLNQFAELAGGVRPPLLT
jgi:hypothetical protein